jgi:hypothetical protein
MLILTKNYFAMRASNSVLMEELCHLVQPQLKPGANLLQVDRFGATWFFIDMMPYDKIKGAVSLPMKCKKHIGNKRSTS